MPDRVLGVERLPLRAALWDAVLWTVASLVTGVLSWFTEGLWDLEWLAVAWGLLAGVCWGRFLWHRAQQE